MSNSNYELNLELTKDVIKKSYPNNSIAILTFGTCVILPQTQDWSIYNAQLYIEDLVKDRITGTLDYDVRWEDDYAILTYSIKDFVSFYFPSELKDNFYKNKDFLALQGRNKTIKDLYNLKVIEII